MLSDHTTALIARQRVTYLYAFPIPRPASIEMDLELWNEPKVVIAIVLLLTIARAVYKRIQTAGRPRVVSYTIPWVGSGIDLGKNPDAFFKRAVYVRQLLICLEARDELSIPVPSTGISLPSRSSDEL